MDATMFDTTQTRAVRPALAGTRRPGVTLLTAAWRQIRALGTAATRSPRPGVDEPIALGATDAELAHLRHLPAVRQPEDVRWDAILFTRFGYRRS